MPIPVRCDACGRGHKAPDDAAGRRFRCRGCGDPLTVPEPEAPAEAVEVDEIPLAADEPPPPRPRPRTAAAGRPKPDLAALPPLTTDDPPFWRRHLHWLLVLAMLPLAGSLLMPGTEADIYDRIDATLEHASPDVRAKVERAMVAGVAEEDLFSLLPGQRLEGACLPRGTYAHWGMAVAATLLFLTFFAFLASDGSADPLHVLGVGLFTATVGVGLLLLVQTIASFTHGHVVVGRGIAVLIFWVFKLIALSYAAADDPANGFVLSFVGFTLGVGLMEELVKTVPLFWCPRAERGKDWRGLLVWGLASGAGFGIAEGVLYSSRYYNGIDGPGIYVVRFVSCVALHAVWSGSVGLTLYLRRGMFDAARSWQDRVAPTLVIIAVPMVLHGLYDTCLKREMNAVALLVAVASFGWLAFLSSRLYRTDDAKATRAMLAEYKRRRQAMS